MAVHLIQSNVQEALLEHLLAILRYHAKPLKTQKILVQNAGIARWLRIQQVKKYGISAEFSHQLPASFIFELYRRIDGEQGPYLPEGSASLSLLLHERMLNDAALQHFDVVLEHPESIFMQAQQLSQIFNQYLLFRPDWILGFENNDPEVNAVAPFQAALWRSLQQHYQLRHRVHLHQQFMQCQDLKSYMPYPALYIFGITGLAPMHLECLIQLARQGVEVYIYWLNPSAAFWQELKKDAVYATNDHEYFAGEWGHPLLTTLSLQRQQFLRVLAHYDQDIVTTDLFIEQNTDNILTALQNDILFAKSSAEVTYVPVPNDHSIQFQLAATRLRELEILHETLIEALNADTHLKASDIVVMMPELDSYREWIHAVFTDPRRETLPFHVADWQVASPTEQAVLAWFDLLSSRLESEAVYEFLLLPAVKPLAVPNFSAQALKKLLIEAQVIWGEDEAHYALYGLPKTAQHTWQQAKTRWTLQVLGETEAQQTYLSEETVERFGIFLPYLDKLLTSFRLSRIHKSFTDWLAFLRTYLPLLFLSTDEDEEPTIYLEALQQLEIQANLLPKDHTVSFAVIAHGLRYALSQPTSNGRGFLSGGITFCQTLPMRAIPFRFIALLGLNDQVFPRQFVPLAEDKMLVKHRLGDLISRTDDREFLMDTVLSARNTLYLSYVNGVDQNQLPSVLYTELQQVLQRYYPTFSSVQLPYKIIDYLIPATTHSTSSLSLVDDSSEINTETWHDLDQLIMFWTHPIRAFAHRHLQVVLDQYPQHLPAWLPTQVSSHTLGQCLKTISDQREEAYAQLLAQQILPPEPLFEYYFNDLWALKQQWQNTLSAPHVADYVYKELALAKGQLLVGHLPLNTQAIYSELQFIVQEKDSYQVRHQLTFYLRHLFACATQQKAPSHCYQLIQTDKNRIKPYHWSLPLVEATKASALLSQFVQWQIQGLTTPLQFVLVESWAFAEAFCKQYPDFLESFHLDQVIYWESQFPCQDLIEKLIKNSRYATDQVLKSDKQHTYRDWYLSLIASENALNLEKETITQDNFLSLILNSDQFKQLSLLLWVDFIRLQQHTSDRSEPIE